MFTAGRLRAARSRLTAAGGATIWWRRQLSGLAHVRHLHQLPPWHRVAVCAGNLRAPRAAIRRGAGLHGHRHHGARRRLRRVHKTAVGSCEVLIVLIDPDWVTTADDAGRRRLDDPEDFVRVEVTAAFDTRRGPSHPGARRKRAPAEEGRPSAELAPLTRRQALEITDGRWDYDLGVLVKTIERLFADRQPAQPQGDKRPAQATPSWFRGHARVAIAVAALAVLAVAALLLTLGGGDGGGFRLRRAGNQRLFLTPARVCRTAG